MHVHVSVAVLINSDNQVLLAQRPYPKSWEGWWEFPGGKVEKDETVFAALYREAYEELGIKVIQYKKWIIRKYSYDDFDITLHFFKVFKWEGKIIPQEKQKLVWNSLKDLKVSPILPANLFIQRAFDLPDYYAITNLSETKKNIFLSQLRNKIDNGLKMIQIREKELFFEELKIFAKEVIDICKPRGVKVIINSNINLALELKVDGVHLTSKELRILKNTPKELMIGASCHNSQEVHMAEKLNVNFVVLSPVKQTLSHPDIKPMGWKKFQEITNNSNIPIYALGGMGLKDYETSIENGGIGIASQRLIWK